MEKLMIGALLSLILSIYNVVKAIGRANENNFDAAFFTMCAATTFAVVFVLCVKKLFSSGQNNTGRVNEIDDEKKEEIPDTNKSEVEDKNEGSETPTGTLHDLFNDPEIVKEAKELRRLYGKGVYFDFIKRKAKENNVSITDGDLELMD